MKSISQYILEYLQLNKKAIVPAFGVFHVETSGAQFNNENKSILPPSQLVRFSPNFEEKDAAFVSYLAKEKNISVQNAQQELQKQIDFWRNKINSNEEFSIPELGEFTFRNHEIIFHGNRLPADNPDFFGLEEIVFSEIKNKREQVGNSQIIENQNYKFSKSILWLFLLILPLLTLAYFAYTNQELVFGKKSFDDISVKNATHRIEDKNPAKVQILKSDSIQSDSLKAVPQDIKNQ